MLVKELKESLEDIDENIEVIISDGDNADEYRPVSCCLTDEEFHREHPYHPKQFIICI